MVTAESMSAYVTYRPHTGIKEADRSVISNIHKNGIPPVEAGAELADLIKSILENRASGIKLKNN
jgi:ethanolamine ammonia-lyase small subunit